MESNKRQHHASELGVDDLVCKVFFEKDLRYYASLSRDPTISEVRGTQPGSFGFTFKGRRYSIHTEDDHSSLPSDPSITRIYLELLQNGNLVFAERIRRQTIEKVNVYSPQQVTEFVEGDWIEDFRDLLKRVAKDNLQRIK